MDQLEDKKLKLELMRVTAARFELEIRIEEYKRMISKLEESIKVQLTKEEELNNQLKGLQ